MKIHGQEVVPPVPALQKPLARALACDTVLKALKSGTVDLQQICTCAADQMDARDERTVERMLTSGTEDDDCDIVLRTGADADADVVMVDPPEPDDGEVPARMAMDLSP